jgi:hypothetical protein
MRNGFGRVVSPDRIYYAEYMNGNIVGKVVKITSIAHGGTIEEGDYQNTNFSPSHHLV